METLGNQNYAKLCTKFFCESCDYRTSRKSSFDNHILSAKHKKHTNMTILETSGNNFMQELCISKYSCKNCSKEFKNRSGLWKHNKVCIVDDFEPDTKPFELTQETFMQILKQNSEFQQMLLEQNKTIIELSKNNSITNNTTNNNSHNKTFNLNMFLNETCKNAMNINEFVDSLQLQMSDLENVGESGYIEGISSIIIKKLNTLDITERPIHCTDKKRETMYIKDQDKWEKEDDKKTKMHKLVTKVANKNINMISEFQKLHPEWKKCSSKYADQHNKIVIESMGGKGDNEYEKQEKIIKKIAKEVFVEKCL
jgi:Txe/YoeB family toxin of Txe-Axe toxin-antitoxin module